VIDHIKKAETELLLVFPARSIPNMLDLHS